MIIFEQFFNNKIVGASALSWFLAQILKILIDCFNNKTLNLKLITSSGGMPSSHSAFVTALAMSTGFEEGFNSTFFAITFVFGMIVMYDAAGVRRAAGKQAEVLNIFIDKYKIKIDSKLKELIGHTPIQVIGGAILGFLVTILLY